MLKRHFILILGLLWSMQSFAQIDPQFSQFYAAPLMVNPGYTGSVAEHRVIFNAEYNGQVYLRPIRQWLFHMIFGALNLGVALVYKY